MDCQIAIQDLLAEKIGMQIRGLFDNIEWCQDLFWRIHPADAHTGCNDLRERTGNYGLVRQVFFYREPGFTIKKQIPESIVFIENRAGGFQYFSNSFPVFLCVCPS